MSDSDSQQALARLVEDDFIVAVSPYRITIGLAYVV